MNNIFLYKQSNFINIFKKRGLLTRLEKYILNFLIINEKKSFRLMTSVVVLAVVLPRCWPLSLMLWSYAVLGGALSSGHVVTMLLLWLCSVGPPLTDAWETTGMPSSSGRSRLSRITYAPIDNPIGTDKIANKTSQLKHKHHKHQKTLNTKRATWYTITC
jgi:hypothetical protein